MDTQKKFVPDKSLKLLDQVRQVLRYHHYATRTEKSYCGWITRYIKYYKCARHPREMGKKEIETFLSHLATNENVAAATQRQAHNALLFLYKHVLHMDFDDQIEPVRSKKQKRLPMVMTQKEVKLVLEQMQRTHLLMAKLMYGGGLRLMECLRLRVKDVDLARKKLYLRGAKGGKDRITLLPRSIIPELKKHLVKIEALHQKDLAEGFGETSLEPSLVRKYPNILKDFKWQFVFPAKKLSKDPLTGKLKRHHIMESGFQKAIKTAAEEAGLRKRVTSHTFRHSFATHLLENGVNIRVVQDLMGHSDVKTTEIYTHVMQKDINRIKSPLDVIIQNRLL